MGTVRRQRNLKPCCRLCRQGALRLQGLRPDSKVRRQRRLQAGAPENLKPKKPEATAKAAATGTSAGEAETEAGSSPGASQGNSASGTSTGASTG